MDDVQSRLHASVGARIRSARQSLNWSLDRLAEFSGVSRRMVVSVEQGAVNASIGTLLRLSDALGIGLPSLVGTEATRPTSPIRRGQPTVLWQSDAGGSAELLGGSMPPNVLELWQWTLGPEDRHDSEAHQIGTQEIAHVIEGVLDIDVAGHVERLQVGETLAFASDADHSYRNPTATMTRFSLVVFEPNVHPSAASVTGGHSSTPGGSHEPSEQA